MTMAEHVSSQDEVFDSIDLSKELSSTHLSEEASKDYTPDRLLDELSFPSSHTPVYQDRDASRNYDQFFEEVSLDLPRESVMAPSSSKIMKFMPRRANSSAATQPEMSITPSDISGPFYSISDVLDDTSSTTAAAAAAAAAVAAAGRDSNADHLNNLNSRAARRNVNEAEVIVTSGGTSIGPVPRRSTLNPFKRPKSINRKPSPLETVISKTRPRMLPPKDPNEEKRHLQQYQAMMKKAVKLEAKKQKEQCRKREERDKKTTNAIHIWENEIIPQWKSKIKDKRTMHLWDQGVPPRCRKRVWKLKIGNESNISKNTFNECLARVPQSVRTPKKKEYKVQPSHQIDTNIPFRRRRTSSLDVLREDKEQDHTNQLPSPNNSSAEDIQWDTVPENHGENGFDGRTAMDLESYDNYSNVDLPEDDDDTSSQDDEDSLDDKEVEDDDDKVLVDPSTINFLNKAIDEDIIRTLPSLCVFQPDGPLFNSLRKVLHAYVGYRPSMTYPRGTSFLAGVLLLNMNSQDTFTALVNLISGSEVLTALYNSDEKKIKGFFKVFNVIFAENLPKLYLHFKNLALTPENYLPDWFMTIFASIIPLELSARLWDIYLLHGDIILFRTGIVVLKYLEPLLWGGGFSETAKILNMGFVGEHRGEEVKAALAVSGHITDGDDDPFFDEILKGVHLDKARYKDLLGAHMPRIT